MPKTTRGGRPKQSELPSTLQKGPTGYAALKRAHEKVGDHWEPTGTAGPSDDRAARGGRWGGSSAGGVDARASKAHLYELARRLDVPGRSTKTKAELVDALQRANARETARSRCPLRA